MEMLNVLCYDVEFAIGYSEKENGKGVAFHPSGQCTSLKLTRCNIGHSMMQFRGYTLFRQVIHCHGNVVCSFGEKSYCYS